VAHEVTLSGDRLGGGGVPVMKPTNDSLGFERVTITYREE
jgi:hypothetical protein